MAKELNEIEIKEEPTSRKSNILYREHLEYTAQRIFWSATIGLSAITIYAAVAWLVVQQLRK